jgi:hypothetical protein
MQVKLTVSEGYVDSYVFQIIISIAQKPLKKRWDFDWGERKPHFASYIHSHSVVVMTPSHLLQMTC